MLAGPIGTGKTHVAISLGVEACRRRYRVAFVRVADLVRELLEARDERTLSRLHRSLEKVFGRERSTRNAPRTLDLDILIYGDQICTTERLTLPHPRMSERAFVLVPLVEIAADIPVGVLGTAEQLLADISATGVKRIGPA